MAGTAGADVEREAAVRTVRQESASPNVVGDRANFQAGVFQGGARSLGGLEDRVNDRVVADVRPGVVHVQHGDVDPASIGLRDGVRGSGVLKKIVGVVDVASGHCTGHDASGMPCSVSEMM